MKRIDILNNILKLYNEFDFPFILFSDFNDKFKKYSSYIDLNESYEISCDFLSEFDLTILELFQNIRAFDKKAFLYKSPEIDANVENSFNLKTGVVNIRVNHDISDIYAQAHELMHKIDGRKDAINRNLILTEVAPMTAELYINEFLVDNDIYMNDSIKYIYNRMLYCVSNAYFIRYIYFLKDLPLKLFNTLKRVNKQRYENYLESLISELPDYLRDNFLANYKNYNEVIAKKHYYYNCLDADLTFRYIYGFSIAPYLFQKNDISLINYINKASYDDTLKLPQITEKEVLNSLKNHFNMLEYLKDFSEEFDEEKTLYDKGDSQCLKMS